METIAKLQERSNRQKMKLYDLRKYLLMKRTISLHPWRVKF